MPNVINPLAFARETFQVYVKWRFKSKEGCPFLDQLLAEDTWNPNNFKKKNTALKITGDIALEWRN